MNEYYIPISILASIAAAHLIKEIIYVLRTKTFSWQVLFQTGGMPSSHSAATWALATSILYTQGMTALFWTSTLLAAIVSLDAFRVRQSVGEQATLLNKLSEELSLEEKTRIVLGHTPLQVAIGGVMGFSIATILYLL